MPPRILGLGSNFGHHIELTGFYVLRQQGGRHKVAAIIYLITCFY
jgi:hypothetical protein